MILKMNAAVVEQLGKPLSLRQRDIPNSLSFPITKPRTNRRRWVKGGFESLGPKAKDESNGHR